MQKLQPAYTTWDDLPFGKYVEAQKIVRDRYRPEEGRITLVEIELLILLYGLTEEQLDLVPADDVPAMWRAVSHFTQAPPVDEELHTHTWFGRTYHVEREPRDISVRQLKLIEEYRELYPDPMDAMLIHCALLVAPERAGAYGSGGGPAPFSGERAHQWDMLRDWPTSVCYNFHAFFLRNWLRSKVLTPLSTLLETIAAAEPGATDTTAS